jgi:radical SAM enzyme (TIGR01210 family)
MRWRSFDERQVNLAYPARGADRDRWILSHRGAKAPLDRHRAYAAVSEAEPDSAGVLQPTSVVFLTNKECPFRCLMCDLWRNTLDARVEPADIPTQIRGALATLPLARWIKLYNAGSFFDPEAIPVAADQAIAREIDRFERVIVEAHPAFLAGAHGERCLRFRDRLHGALEVAVGLETAHAEVLARLNKRMTLESFRGAAEFLARHAIALRVFILLKPPFMSEDEGVEWACRSIDLAADCGAVVCSIIPTRGGNGAMEALGESFSPPRLTSLETVVEYGLSRANGRVRILADLWDADRLDGCDCAADRLVRLHTMNRDQQPPAPVVCACLRGR